MPEGHRHEATDDSPIIWVIDSEADRCKAHAALKTFPQRRSRLAIGELGGVLFVVSLFYYGSDPGRVMLGVAILLVVANLVHFWITQRRYSLQLLEMRFLPGAIRLTEQLTNGEKVRRSNFNDINAKHFASAHWLQDGCWLEGRRVMPLTNRVLLPHGFFHGQADIDALQKWAENNGITVEGTPQPSTT